MRASPSPCGAPAAACESDLLEDSSILFPFLQLSLLMEDDGLEDTVASPALVDGHLDLSVVEEEAPLGWAEGREGRDWVTTLP